MTETEWITPNDLQIRSSNKAADDLELENYDLEQVEKIIILKAMAMHQEIFRKLHPNWDLPEPFTMNGKIWALANSG